MNKKEKEFWVEEAKKQMEAIKRLEKYNIAFLALAGLGAALCYFSVTAGNKNPLYIACSVILAVIGAMSSTIISIGIRNGKKNVERILNAVEGKEEKQELPGKPGKRKKAASGEGADKAKEAAPEEGADKAKEAAPEKGADEAKEATPEESADQTKQTD